MESWNSTALVHGICIRGIVEFNGAHGYTVSWIHSWNHRIVEHVSAGVRGCHKWYSMRGVPRVELQGACMYRMAVEFQTWSGAGVVECCDRGATVWTRRGSLRLTLTTACYILHTQL